MLVAVYAFDVRGYKRLYSFSFWGFCILLIIIAGLRYRIGTDSIVYESYYETVPRLWEFGNYKFQATRFEPGFIVAQSITRSISDDFTLFQFFEAIVVNVVVFWFILKNTTHRFLCVAFYFIFLYLNLCTQVLREAFAVSIFLLSWPFFRDGKWLQYYILAILATFFHTSAFFLLFVPVFCLPGIREIFKIGKRTIIICIGLLAIGLYIQAQFSNLFSLMAFTERMVDRVNTYKDNDFSGGKLNVAGIVFQFLQYCLYPLIAVYFLNKTKVGFKIKGKLFKRNKQRKIKAEKQKVERQFDRFEMMVLLGVYSMMLSMTVFILGRYFNYFGLFCLACVSTWAFTRLKIGKKQYRLHVATWALILLPYFGFTLYSYANTENRAGTLRQYMLFYPYYTRLDPQVDQEREHLYRYLDVR